MSSSISSTPSTTTPTTNSSTGVNSSAVSAANTLISSEGIGSGLDINAIVQALTTAQGLAQNTQLADRQQALNAQVSAYGTFQSALETLQAALTPLQTASSLAANAATVADDTVASVTANADAVPATYSLGVQNLATAASLSSQAFASANTAIGIGTLTIAVGGVSTDIAIDSSDNTVAGIAAAINGAPNNPGVTASVLTTSAGSRLILSGTKTGATNSITVTESGGDGGLSALVYNPAGNTTNLTQTQAALDANFTINGFAATSPTNQVSGAVSGLTINLLKTTPTGSPTTVTVAADTSDAQTSIGTFVTALNGLITAIQGLTSYDPSTQTAGPLLGNPTLESFQNQLQNVLDQVQGGSAATGTSLASLGITANTQGTYDTNASTLGNALSGALSSVTGLFSGTNGIASQLNSLINTYTEPGGLLDTINQGLQSGLTDVANQQTALNARLATYSATLTAEYNAMDNAVALLKQTQTYLTAEFNPQSAGSTSQANSQLSSGTLSTTGSG
jgi:flagellar hook-associated protein 2